MASLGELAAVVADNSFRYRVAMGMYTVAREVLGEKEHGRNNEVRDAFARHIISTDYTQALPYAAVVVADPEIANQEPLVSNQVSDDKILAAIRQIWDSLAGVMGGHGRPPMAASLTRY